MPIPTEYRTRWLAVLRIAVTVLSLTVCLLLIALWVRSSRVNEFAGLQVSNNRSVGVTSLLDRLIISMWNQPGERGAWWVHSEPLNFSVREAATLRWRGNGMGFGIIRFQANGEVISPHWFLVLLTATLAAIPWMHWRFSLRTLLVATTLVAVMLGLLVVMRT